MKSNLRHPGNTTRISDNNADHVRRGSLGGTDFVDPYGTPVHAQLPGGVVTIVDNSPSGSGGRYSRVTGPDGDSVESLHQHAVTAVRGQRIATEDDVIGVSGASAFGSNTGTGGPHIHNHGVPMRNLEPYYWFLNGGSQAAAGNVTPIEEDDMFTDNDKYALELVLGAAARMELGVYGITKKTDIIAWATTDDSQGLRRMVADLTALVQKAQSGKALTGSDVQKLAAVVEVPAKLLEKADSTQGVEDAARAKLAEKPSILSALPELEARGINIQV